MPAAENMPMRRALALTALAGGLAMIMLVSDLNGGRIQDLSLTYPGIDKLAHFGMHAALVGALFVIVRRYWPGHSLVLTLGIASAASVLFGLIDEGHQYFIGGREFDLFDVAANLCGTAASAVTISALTQRSLRRLTLIGIPLALFAGVLVHAQSQAQHFIEGIHLIRTGDYAGARQAFLDALAQGHASPGLYNELAWIELEYLPVDPAPALEYTAHAMTYDEDNPDYLDTRGWALYRNGRYEEALEALLAAYAGNPEIFCIHYHLGATYHALGRDAEAIEHLSLQLTRSTDRRFAEKARTLLATLQN